ncbi:hypothetical protein, partial [Gluconacetobacter sp.]|uniref:hypothetical protein n=1 Tax=Gluconacetobacter sp. TaxID=1935994 RepID=UPI0039EC4C95
PHPAGTNAPAGTCSSSPHAGTIARHGLSHRPVLRSDDENLRESLTTACSTVESPIGALGTLRLHTRARQTNTMSHPARFLRRAILVLSSAALMGHHIGAYAADTARHIHQFGMSGTIGDRPIAMVATLENGTRVVDIHYSYASQGRTIPLTATIARQTVTLSAPDGGVFDLHFVSSAHPAPAILDFDTATGLQGTWHQGSDRQPVSIRFVLSRDHLEDCIFYPSSIVSGKPHFPDQGCEHTPDRTLLNACITKPYVSDATTVRCLDSTLHTCRADQRNMTMCALNLTSYLEQAIAQRLDTGGQALLDGHAYRRWDKKIAASCKATSDFSPDGSGYAADQDLCTARERLRLLQNGLRPSATPIRPHRAPQ